MKHSRFYSQTFQAQVESALKSVRRILDSNRKPKLAAEVHEHQYSDKYALAEFLTNTAIAAQWNILERMGMTADLLGKLQEHVRDKQSLTLRFEAEDTCEFWKETQADVVAYEGRTETETTTGQPGSIFSQSNEKSSNYKVVKKVTEYHWRVGMKHKLLVFAGSDPRRDPQMLQSRSSVTVITTTGDRESILPKKSTHPPIDVDVTWLVEQTIPNDRDKKRTDTTGTSCFFRIDRKPESCKTPVRNDDIQAALNFFMSFRIWSSQCNKHFKKVERRILGRHSPANSEKEPKRVSLGSISVSQLFCPIVPLLEEPASRVVAGTATRQETPKSLLVFPLSCAESESPLLSLGDIDKFLNEQIRSLDESFAILSRTFASENEENLITAQEAKLTLFWASSIQLFQHYENSVYYIEEMLRKQLIAAIGKQVEPKDFDQFMSYHMAKLFGSLFRPKPFCYAIRRPNQYPDGVLSIEQNGGTSSTDMSPAPVRTIVRHIEGACLPPFEIPIDAATKIAVSGDRFLHGWIRHRFESSRTESFNLAARARQFSSFLVMVGVMGGANEFHPKNAIIVRNKDEVLIPLLLNELPTAKDFKDAISSLSPEQQRFAKSFRSMQLESSVFGVCVLQLKPQLEALLGLPSGALNKEIRLTQDLMSLFVHYQIPSDLLTFDGSADSSRKDKVNLVKEHVRAVLDVINESKQSQLQQATSEAEMNVNSLKANASSLSGSTAPQTSLFGSAPPPGGMFGSATPKGAAFGTTPAPSPFGSAPAPSPFGSAPAPSPFGAPAPAPFGSQPSLFGASPGASGSASTSFGAPAPIPAPRPPAGGSGGFSFGAPSPAWAPPPQPRQKQSFAGGFSSAPPASYGSYKQAASGSKKAAETESPPVKATSTNVEVTQSATVPATAKSHNDAKPTFHQDFTMIPKQLDSKFEEHDSDNSVRSTIIETSKSWSLKRQENLLTKKIQRCTLTGDDIRTEKQKAFDLLDAISCCGSMEISCAELHVIVAVTHYFENDIMGTVIQDNINPIEKVEGTALMVASTIHGLNDGAAIMIQDDSEQQRLVSTFPSLFANPVDHSAGTEALAGEAAPSESQK